MENVMEQPPTVVCDETVDVIDDGTEYPDRIVGEITTDGFIDRKENFAGTIVNPQCCLPLTEESTLSAEIQEERL
jgi:hypothetical protein